jgi:hypothetical protein
MHPLRFRSSGGTVSKIGTRKYLILMYLNRQHEKRTYNGSIHSYRKEDGEIYMLKITSQDGLIELRHSVDLSSSAPRETSMKPFLDNCHIDKTHKFRVQFQGGHKLKITKRDSQGMHTSEKRGQHIQHNPIYKFKNKKGNRWHDVL